MQVTADILNFKPPRPGRWGKPVALALVAHALLMAALTWGVHWKQDEPPVAFEAEIWSALPRDAAPRAVQPPPPPPEPEPVKPEPQPEPRPEPKPAPPPPQPTVKQPDIATEKAKQKKLEEEKEKRAELEQAKKEKALKDKAEREKKEKELAEKKKLDDQKKIAEKKKQDELRREAERREELAAEKNRKDQLARMMGQAGASGGPEARGSAQRSEGPSSGYGARVQAKVRPNIRYSEEFPRSLRTEIEVRATPDGTITGRRVVEGSGNPAWDDAALKAIDRTGSLPRDIDGRVPSPIIIVVRPTD